MRKKVTLYLLVIFFILGGGALTIYETHFKAPDITLLGSVKMSDGLGRHPVELIQAFGKEMRIGMIHTTTPNFIDVPKQVRGAIKKKYRRQGKILLSFDSVWTPTYSCISKLKEDYAENQLRIAYSMFESSQLPPEWVTILNCYFDAVIVPDAYYLDVYKMSGVNRPIFVLPLAINLQDCLNTPLKKEVSTPFVFGNLSACTQRKNQRLLIEAFFRAFKNAPDVLLKINSRSSDPLYEKEIREYLEGEHITNVQISKVCLDRHAYLNFLSHLDCYVNLSQGEGFSIQPREAMAMGIPTMVTRNTAQITIANNAPVAVVDTPIQVPAIYDWNKERAYGEWSTCSAENVAEALILMRSEYSSFLKHSEKARQWAASYDFSALKPLYKTLLCPKKVELGKENLITSEKIVTTCPYLVKKYESVKKGR